MDSPPWLQQAPTQVNRINVDVDTWLPFCDKQFSLLFAFSHLSLWGSFSFDLARNFFFITTCTFCCLQPIFKSFFLIVSFYFHSVLLCSSFPCLSQCPLTCHWHCSLCWSWVLRTVPLCFYALYSNICWNLLSFTYIVLLSLSSFLTAIRFGTPQRYPLFSAPPSPISMPPSLLAPPSHAVSMSDLSMWEPLPLDMASMVLPPALRAHIAIMERIRSSSVPVYLFIFHST